MRFILSAFAFSLLPVAAMAQTAPSATPYEQALGAKLMTEINVGLQCASSLTAVQRELATAQQRIKELEAKAAPSTPESPAK